MSAESDHLDLSARTLLRRVDEEIVGLRREAEVLAVALVEGRHVVLEGPPGTGKSTLLRVVAEAAGLGVAFVEGNAELTPARLVGHHDPAMVLEAGYTPDAFVDGPLVTAMREGRLLYLEELNRVPEETLNVLITALAEGVIFVPRLGEVRSAGRFRLIAAMNPYDAIGTARVGQAIYDRMCRIAIGYQTEESERTIVERATGVAGRGPAEGRGTQDANGWVVPLAVALVRATRAHAQVRTGSSVRGAIDMVRMARGLAELRDEEEPSRDSLRDAALAALSGRIRLDEGTERTPEAVVTELLDALLAAPEDGPGKAPSPASPSPGASRGDVLEGQAARDVVKEASRRTTSRHQLAANHEALEAVSPQVGELDEAAFEALYADDPDEALALLADLAVATDPVLRARARRLAAKVFVRMGRGGRAARRGLRRVVPEPGWQEGDVDLDRTLERAGGLRPRSGDDLVVRRWRAPERAVCLLVDRSGSMSGEAVALAAVAASSVVLAAGDRTDTSVVAFNRDAVVLQEQGRRRPPHEVVEDLLTLRGRGTTDVALALTAARRQLGRAPATEKVVVLLSDCLATAGADPLAAAGGIDRLHVLGTSDDPESVRAGQTLAQRTGGRYLRLADVAAVAPAMTSLLG